MVIKQRIAGWQHSFCKPWIYYRRHLSVYSIGLVDTLACDFFK